ncbi:uncharacterized protein LOC129945193 [Eupeodes corollae]|uniref:uncharacterized protein LOC129945193 n=1 Tax=Eupeodes corollae TaxID=290404 RepID=UPI0024905C11|nr:uncharacterized protein LOC129945193 [Eupeodes corollae]
MSFSSKNLGFDKDVTTASMVIDNHTYWLVSAYLGHDHQGQLPGTILEKTVAESTRQKTNLIIGCDANEHHTTWSSTDINNRGRNDSSSTENYRKQRFNDAWLELLVDCFKGWLSKTDDVFKCKCEACDKILYCGKSKIKKHAITKLHQRNVTSIKNSRNVNSFFKPKQTVQSVDRETSNFEIKLSLFFDEHNVAFEVIEHLNPLLKNIVTDSKIIKNSKLGRKKCTSIIKNVLAKEETEELVDKLKKYKFSIMIDESTDICLNKLMCVMVRFFDDEDGKVVVRLLDLLKVESDCSAEALYKKFKDLILDNEIPFENIIDKQKDLFIRPTCTNYIKQQLVADNQKVVVIKCICHSAAIIAKKTCLTLPRAPEELLRQIGNYVSGSSKRCLQLE